LRQRLAEQESIAQEMVDASFAKLQGSMLQSSVTPVAGPREPRDLLPLLREGITEWLQQEERETLRTLDIVRILRRPYSSVAFLRVGTQKGSRQLVAKTIALHPENRGITDRANQAVVEYEILRALWPQFRTVERCGVPRPLAVLPEAQTYVMEYVEGRLLSDELRHARRLSSRSGFARLCDSYFECGRWLSLFQGFTGSRRVTPEALDGMLGRCAGRLRAISEAKDSRWRPGLEKEVMAFLADQRAALADENILVTGRHGDFGPWNVLTGSEGITVIDFLGYEEEPVALDILSMLMVLENERHCLSASPTRIGILERRFLQGFGTLPQVQRPVYLICETLLRISTVWGCMSRPVAGFRRRIENYARLKANRQWLERLGGSSALWPENLPSHAPGALAR
jgi:tRNA A-37 threonylcarbamoyl transferase component Bud32